MPATQSTMRSLRLAVLAVTMVAGCRDNSTDDVARLRAAVGDDAEQWYGVYMQGVKVGHSTTRIRIIEDQGETLVETTTASTIESKKGQDIVRLSISATSVETADGGLRSFSRSIDAGAGPQQTTGRVVGDRLMIEESTGARRAIEWQGDWRGFAAWQRMLIVSPPADGEVRSFRALDESFLVVTPQELVGGRVEETSTPGGPRKLRRMEHRLTMPDGQRRATQLWLDEQGACIKLRDDAMDIEFHRLPREAALAPSTATLNLLDDVLVKLDPPLANARQTRLVRYRVSTVRGDIAAMFAACPGQAVRKLDDHTIELIVREVTPDTNLAEAAGGVTFTQGEPPPDESFLKPNYYLASLDPRIAAIARDTAATERDPVRIAVALERRARAEIKEFDYSQAFLTAPEVLDAGKGDCSEHAVLLAALLRSRGIPSRVAVGLVYVEREAAFGYHMWTEAWLNGRWVGLDATLGEGRVAADHLKVAATNLENGFADSAFIALGQLLGAKPKIEVVDAKHREKK